MVGTQRIHVGMIHARKTVTVAADKGQFLLSIDSEMIGALPCTTTRGIHRYKAYARPAQAPAAASTTTQRGPPAVTEISAAAQIDASPEYVWAILADLASYPQWNPLFREASAFARIGEDPVTPNGRLVATGWWLASM